ncbi:T9SS type A sorting domain-containing protein [bacterium]|nr:T9SS type A sorting domain-containing protein [bacterium]
MSVWRKMWTVLALGLLLTAFAVPVTAAQPDQQFLDEAKEAWYAGETLTPEQRAVLKDLGAFRDIEPPSNGLDRFVGPDNYGYVVLDSDEPDGPDFDYVDITGTGTVPTIPGDDDYTGPLPIGFDFPFYGNTYTEWYLGSNGMIGFGPTTGITTYTNGSIPSTDTPNNLIAWFWDDLDPDNGAEGTCYYQNMMIGDINALVIQFVDWDKFNGGPDQANINAEVIIDERGRVLIQYQDLSTMPINSCTIGIENEDGSDGLAYVYNDESFGVPYNGLALMFQEETTLSGYVTDAATGQPIENAQVGLFEQGAEDPFVGDETDPNGYYEITVHASGTYDLKSGAPGYQFGEVTGLVVTYGHNLSQDIALQPSETYYSVEGHVYSADSPGTPVEGVSVMMPHDGRSTLTDETGYFNLGGVLEGLYNFEIGYIPDGSGGYHSEEFNAVYINADELPLEFVLPEIMAPINLNGSSFHERVQLMWDEPTNHPLHMDMNEIGERIGVLEEIIQSAEREGTPREQERLAPYKQELVSLRAYRTRLENQGELDNINDFQQYAVEVTPFGGTPWIEYTNSTDTQYDVLNLTDGTLYTMRVAADYGYGEDYLVWSDPIEIRPLPTDIYNYTTVPYEWVEIRPSEGGNGIPLGFGLDSVHPIDFGNLSFSYFGIEYSEFYVCSNGFLDANGNSVAYIPNMPSTYAPNGTMGVYWTDLHASARADYDGWYFVDETNNRVIVEWYAPHYYNYNVALFQVIIDCETNAIQFNYNTTEYGWNNNGIVGIENPEGTAASIYDGEITDQMSLQFFLPNDYAVFNGTVTDQVSGDPIEGVTVQAEDTDGTLYDAQTTEEGLYDLLVSTDAEPFDFTVTHPNYVTHTLTGESTGPDFETTLDFTLEPLGTITGTVTNSLSGSPMEGVEVTVDNGLGDVYTANTDENGVYLFDRMLNRSHFWIISTQPSGFLEHSEQISFGQDEYTITHDIAVTPDQPFDVEGGLFMGSEQGPGVSGVTVAVPALGISTTTGTQGEVLLQNVVAGQYDLTINYADAGTNGYHSAVYPDFEFYNGMPFIDLVVQEVQAPTNLNGTSRDEAVDLSWSEPPNHQSPQPQVLRERIERLEENLARINSQSARKDERVRAMEDELAMLRELQAAQKRGTGDELDDISDFQGYRIRVTDFGGNSEILPDLTYTEQYKVDGLTNGELYTFEVAADYGYGEETLVWSDPVEVRPLNTFYTAGPTDFEWIEIRPEYNGSGQLLGLGDDAVSNFIDFGGPAFTYDGQQYTGFYVCSNGFISFTDAVSMPRAGTMPSTGSPNATIAPFWADLDPGNDQSEDVWYWFDTANNLAVVQYYSGFYPGPLNNPMSFEAVFYFDSGEIQFNFDTAEAGWSGYTVGIESVDGTGASVVDNDDITDQSSFRFQSAPSDWAGITGTVYDNDTSNPIAGAEITIADSNTDDVWTGESDQNGRYMVTVPRSGAPFTIDYIAPGYQQGETVELTTLEQTFETTQDLYLTLYHAPSAFSLTSPVDGSLVYVGGDTTLTWEESTDPDINDPVSYVVYWAGDANFLTNLDSATTTETSFDMTDMADFTTRYWKVRAQDRYTTGTWSNETWMFEVFTVEPPNAFSLIGPEDGTVTHDPFIEVSWEETTDPDPNDGITYRVEWSTSSDFAQLNSATTTETSYTIDDFTSPQLGRGNGEGRHSVGPTPAPMELDDLPDDNTYYWRVYAVDEYSRETLADGGPLSFSVDVYDSPAPFDLFNPADQSTVWDPDTTLEWQETWDPDPYDDVLYQVYWSTYSDFQYEVQLGTDLTVTEIDFTNLMDDTTYYWKVHATDQNTEGTWSNSVFQFSTYFLENPNAFSLTGPSDGTLFDVNQVELTWDMTGDPDPDDVVSYDVYVWEAGAGMPGEPVATVSDGSYTFNASDDTDYAWTVMAVDDHGLETTADNGPLGFSTYIPEAPTAFNLTSPTDGTTVPTLNPTLDWEASTDPDPDNTVTYMLEYAFNEQFTDATTHEGLTTNSYLFEEGQLERELQDWLRAQGLDETLPDDVTVYWRVLAEDVNTTGTWSNGGADQYWSFDVYFEEPPHTFTLETPADDAVLTSTAVSLTWTNVGDPDPLDNVVFDLYIWEAGESMPATPTVEGYTSNTYDWSGALDDTSYEWQVVSRDPQGNTTEATNGPRGFSIYIPEAPTAFTLDSPADGSTVPTLQPTGTWNPSTDPDPDNTVTYMVEWALNSDFTDATTVSGLTETFYAFDSQALNNAIREWLRQFEGIDEVPDDVTVYWRVLAEDVNTAGTWSNGGADQYWSFDVYFEQPPGAFDLTSPSDMAVLDATTAELTWTESEDPDPNDQDLLEYDLYVWSDGDPMPDTPTVTGLTTTNYTWTNGSDDGTYHWQVIAIDPQGNETTSTSGPWSFSIYIPDAPNAFNLISPTDGNTLEDRSPILTWEESYDPDPDNTVTYMLEWDLNSDFSTSNTENGLTGTSYELDPILLSNAMQEWLRQFEGMDELPDDVTVYWRVLAEDVNTAGTWSNGGADQFWSFNVYVEEAPGDFTLTGPENFGTFASNTVELTWTESIDPDPNDTDLVEYDLYIWLNGEAMPEVPTVGGLTTESYTWTDAADETDYQWQVVAYDPQGSETSASNGPWDFSIYIPEPPAPFSLLTPADGDEVPTLGPTLTWETTTDPDQGDEVDYTLVWSVNDETFSSADSVTGLITGSYTFEEEVLLGSIRNGNRAGRGGRAPVSLGGSASPSKLNLNLNNELDDLLPDDITLYWYVRAADTNTNGTLSDQNPNDGTTWTFDVANPEAPSAPALTGPTDAEEIDALPVAFSWTAATDPDPDASTTYELEIADNSSFSDATVYDAGTALTYDVSALEDDTDYWWRVLATDNNTDGTYSEVWTFSTYLPDAPSAPTLTAPADGSIIDGMPLTFSWDEATDPDPGQTPTYEFHIADNPDFTDETVLDAELDLSVELTDLADDTDYYWYVLAVDSNTDGTASETWSFSTYYPENPDAPGLVSPDDAAVLTEQPVTFEWTASTDPDPADVVNYTLEIADNENFTDPAVYNADTQLSRDVDDLEDNTDYWWRVLAEDDVLDGTYSVTRTFSTAFPNAPTAPELVLPDDGAVIEALPVTFEWEASTDPDGTTPGYQLEVADNPDFTDADEYDAGTGTTWTVEGLLDDTDYWWRVKATDDNTDGTYSETRTFATAVPEAPGTPDLVAPEDEAVIDELPMTFEWTEVTDPDPDQEPTYMLEIADNQSFTDPMTFDAGMELSFEVEDLEDDTQYWWHVLATDTNTEGSWSGIRTFTTSIPDAPGDFSLLEPADGTMFATDEFPISFSWEESVDPDGDEVSYTLQIALSEDFSDAEDFDAGTETSYEIVEDDLSELATYYWRVIATDDSEQALETYSAEEWTFTLVDALLSRESGIPTEWALQKVYPNPFNPTVNVVVAVPEPGEVRVAIYNVLGREVAVLTDRLQQPGYHYLSWHANGPSGMYFVRMTTKKGFVATQKLMFVK